MAESSEQSVERDKREGNSLTWVWQALDQLRIKLTTPYAFLAVAVAFAATYLATSLLVGVLNDRFQNALLDAARQAADTVVRIEREHLAVWRAIAYTEGFAEAVAQENVEAAGALALPLVLNSKLECFDVVVVDGDGLLAMHHIPGGGLMDYDLRPGTKYGDWEIVQKVLRGETDEHGDKYAGLVKTEWGWVFYTAGPIKQGDELVGVLLVGTYLDSLVKRLDAAALARISIFAGPGAPIVTTLAPEEPEALEIGSEEYRRSLEYQAVEIARREVEVAGRGYAEVIGPFEARYGTDLGVMTVALPLSFITDARQPTRQSLLILFSLATALVLVVGSVVATMIVRRVHRLAAATRRVADGDLDAQVEARGYDELAALSRDFNQMVHQLREGRMYRSLLGLTASPEIAERLREAYECGRVQLEAQSTVATVLFADIRGFTQYAESREPAQVMRFLNEYLQGLVGIIREHDGVINRFFGDAAMAFFGVLPEAQPAAESAENGLTAALAILHYVEEFNLQLQARGDAPLRIGVGVCTGPVVAGTIGSVERLDYTLLGDTVNIAYRLSYLNKEYPQWDLFVSADTYRLLEDGLALRATRLANVYVKGRTTPLDVYAIEEP